MLGPMCAHVPHIVAVSIVDASAKVFYDHMWHVCYRYSIRWRLCRHSHNMVEGCMVDGCALGMSEMGLDSSVRCIGSAF
jgi:hypothetical protein